jgi:hypothetical protein
MLTRIALATGLLVATCGALSAGPLVFAVTGTFADGATVSGSITFDNVSGTVVSFHVVTQFNAGDGLGTTYDSATGTATVQFPIAPPPVTGTYFAILFTDASANNALNLILAGSPSNFGGGAVVPSVPLQQVNGSLLSEEISLISFIPRRESAAGILLSGPPSTAAPVPALTLPWVSVAFVLLAGLGAKSLGGSRFDSARTTPPCQE